MTGRRAVEAAVAVLAVVVVVLVAGSVLGQPVLLSYVETGSMEPTLEAGDGFVAVPSALAGPVEEGDVVVFEAERLHGGGLTTHRVVGETEHGYVTKGDANPVTDQDGGEPHVTDGQVVAEALQVNGEVVVVPHLGTAALTVRGGLEAVQFRLAALLGTSAVVGVRGLAYLLLAAGVGSLAVGTWRERGRRPDRDRTRRRSREGTFRVGALVFGFAVLVTAVTAGTMTVASGTHEHGVVSAEFDSERADVIPAGETETTTYDLRNGGALPMVVVLEPASEGVAVEPREHYLGPGGTAEATLSVTAPPETGYYLRSVAEYRYFAVLPSSVVVSLHAVHPWLARAAVTAVPVGALLLPVVLLVGTDGRIRVRERTRESVTRYRYP